MLRFSRLLAFHFSHFAFSGKSMRKEEVFSKRGEAAKKGGPLLESNHCKHKQFAKFTIIRRESIISAVYAPIIFSLFFQMVIF